MCLWVIGNNVYHKHLLGVLPLYTWTHGADSRPHAHMLSNASAKWPPRRGASSTCASGAGGLASGAGWPARRRWRKPRGGMAAPCSLETYKTELQAAQLKVFVAVAVVVLVVFIFVAVVVYIVHHIYIQSRTTAIAHQHPGAMRTEQHRNTGTTTTHHPHHTRPAPPLQPSIPTPNKAIIHARPHRSANRYRMPDIAPQQHHAPITPSSPSHHPLITPSSPSHHPLTRTTLS
jgi:hypothetical protein